MKKRVLDRKKARPKPIGSKRIGNRPIGNRVERLNLLLELGRILNSTLDHQEVKRRAMEAATYLMKAEVGSLLLIDEEQHHLYFEVALGEKEETVKTVTLNMGEALRAGLPRMVNL